MNRRDFLRGSAALAGTLAAGLILPSDVRGEGFARLEPSAQRLRFSNVPANQGANTTWIGSNKLVINSRICPPGSRHQTVDGTVRVFDVETKEEVAATIVQGVWGDDYRIRATFEGLDPKKHYRYEVRGDEFSKKPFTGYTHSPLAKTPPRNGLERNYVRLVFASCMEYTRGYWHSFAQMASRNPDAFFIIGDRVYADVEQTLFSGKTVRDDPMPFATDYQLMLAKYLSCNDDDLIRALGSQKGIYVPDDHEIRNNVEGALKSKRRVIEDGYKAFSQVMASPDDAVSSGLYRRIDFWQGTRVLVLDTRRFRDKGNGTMLGKEQLNWLNSELSEAKSDNVGRLLIVSSVSFTSGLERIQDSWAGFPEERQSIINRIADLGLKNVSFVSGDLHTFYTGAVRLDPHNQLSDIIAYEFEGGAVSSKVGRTGKVNPNVLANSKESHGIMEMDIYEEGHLLVTWWLYDAMEKNYVAQQAARFYCPPQDRYYDPRLSLQTADPALISNPGDLVLAR